MPDDDLTLIVIGSSAGCGSKRFANWSMRSSRICLFAMSWCSTCPPPQKPDDRVGRTSEQSGGARCRRRHGARAQCDPHHAAAHRYPGVDISEVVKAKQNAEGLVKQLTLLQDVAHVGFWSVDLDSEEVHWSKEVFRIHGIDDTKPTPKLEDAINFYHPDDREDVAKMVENIIDKGGNCQFEKRIITQTGDAVLIESHGHAVQDETGRVTKIIGVFRDLSAQ